MQNWEVGVILSVTLTIVAFIIIQACRFCCWFIHNDELLEEPGHRGSIWTIQSLPCPIHSTGQTPEQCSHRDVETPPPTYESLFGDSR